ncbi:cytochrome c oxidase subunit II [Methylovorus sp. MP688]|uniref:cytochrome c oxidase subunit II n=1 Tax=Methylovorus sp. (strain MP688) TaxID=887061 RepID=UPI0006762AEA|nr:cytochrome c oxidase subunit II [Methylovorus sp. MP688]
MARLRITRIWQCLLGALLPLTAHADYAWNFPKPVTPMALDTLQVHNKFMIIVMVIFVVVLGIMIYSIVMHRKSRDYQPAGFTGPSTRAQLFWTLVPFAILLYIDFILMGIPAFHSVVAMEDTRTDADMVIKVTGSQWRWQYEYMDGPAKGISFVSNMTTPQEQINNQAAKNPEYLLEVDNPLVLPTDKKVRVLLTSSDVIHNWWIPAFGAARDAIPGFLRETWVKIEEPGTFRGQCKELCGKGHGFMPAVVIAKNEQEFNAWATSKKAELQAAAAGADKEWTKEDLIANGKGIYEKNCAVCHQVGGQGLPPAFPALTGSKIATGPILDKDNKMVKDGHLDRVMNGKGVMPAWKGILNDTEIASVITYERNALGNSVGDMLQPAQVKAMR